MFSTPCERRLVSSEWIFSFVDDTQVRWASGVTLNALSDVHISAVYWEVPPPAPYVTLMYDGLSSAINVAALKTEANLSFVLGGKTSKERLGLL